jgi:undecaprenyl diphosphate synthase
MRLCLAVNYGSRAEIIAAARELARDARDGRLDPDAIDEEGFAARLDTAGMPDPDLLVRTAGEMRVSNFLLWQISYAELWVTDVCWPEFTEAHLDAALAAFAGRDRRFGGLSPS